MLSVRMDQIDESIMHEIKAALAVAGSAAVAGAGTFVGLTNVLSALDVSLTGGVGTIIGLVSIFTAGAIGMLMNSYFYDSSKAGRITALEKQLQKVVAERDNVIKDSLKSSDLATRNVNQLRILTKAQQDIGSDLMSLLSSEKDNIKAEDYHTAMAMLQIAVEGRYTQDKTLSDADFKDVLRRANIT